MSSGEDRKKIGPPYSAEGYEQTGSYSDEDDADRKVIAQLVDLGADLSKPRHAIHYMYFDSEAHADTACVELEQMGFAVSAGEELQAESQVLRWPVIAERTEVINEEVILTLREALRQTAQQHGGEYDGWEASSA